MPTQVGLPISSRDTVMVYQISRECWTRAPTCRVHPRDRRASRSTRNRELVYVSASAAFVVFILQILPDLLALIYVPSAGEAWNSLQTSITTSRLVVHPGLHGWGSNFMVAIVLIHMAGISVWRVTSTLANLRGLWGFLLLVTLGMAFTGQVLRFDQDAYWAWDRSIDASRVHGWAFDRQINACGPIIAGATLSRFFALHVFVVPGLLIAFCGRSPLMF